MTVNKQPTPGNSTVAGNDTAMSAAMRKATAATPAAAPGPFPPVQPGANFGTQPHTNTTETAAQEQRANTAMNQNQNYGAAHPAAAAAPFSSAAAQGQNLGIRTLGDFKKFNPNLIGATAQAEAVSSFIARAKELAEATATHGQYLMDVLPLNKGEPDDIYVSAVILVVRDAQNPTAGLAYHVMLLSDTAEDPAPYFPNTPGMQGVEVLRVMSDAYDDVYKQAVWNLLRNKYPQIGDNNFYDAEAEVIPKGYDFKDLNLVRKTLMNAGNAVTTQLNSANPEFTDVSLGALTGTMPNTQARLAFQQPQSSNEVGDPVRTDTVIEFIEVSGQGGNNQVKNGVPGSLNSGEQTTKLARVGGFFDLVWAPSGQFQSQNPYLPAGNAYGNVPQQIPFLYRPRFVITRMELPVVTTLPMQILALLPTLILRENNNWMGGFARPHGEGFDMHDIGAIGIEVNADNNPNGIGTRFDTKADSFKPQNLGQLLSAFVSPELAISFDIDEYGPTTWRDSVWAAAANGNPNANRALQHAMDLLTNGEFSKRYNGQIIMNDNNRVHTGWYVDSNGVKIDLRNIDHLCVLNMLGEKDPAAARDWSDTFAQNQYPIEQRLAVRRRILTQVLRDVHITGFAQRFTFVGEALRALAEATAAAGLQIRLQNLYQDMSGQPRASAQWIERGGIAAGNYGVFARGFTNQPGQVLGGAPAIGRWR
jgi:hypothetical protein